MAAPDSELEAPPSPTRSSSSSHDAAAATPPARHRVWRAVALAAAAVGVVAAALSAGSLGQAAAEQAEHQPRQLTAAMDSMIMPSTTTVAPYVLPECNNPARWVQQAWSWLSEAEQDNLMMLGWTQKFWDAAHPQAYSTTTADPNLPAADTTTYMKPYIPPASKACFQDLEVDRQDAVMNLGYTIETWHACEALGCSWPDGIPMPNAPCLEQMLYLRDKHNVAWNELSFATRNASKDLGWDEYGKMWAIADTPKVYSLPWVDLMPREKRAASFLGYAQNTWERCEKETSCIVRTKVLEDTLRGYKWGKMPQAIQAHLSALQWVDQTWTEGHPPAPMQLSWMDLPYVQRTAATLLGYTQDVWMKCPMAPCLERFAFLKNKYGKLMWGEMKLAVQQAWMLLEYTPELWKAGLEAPTKLFRWEELTVEQRKQAVFLGYDLGTWHGCNQNWKAGAVGPNSTGVQRDPLRSVRGRMVIPQSFTDIAGNVYGQEVADVPTSFIEVFETAVSRSLFCGNPVIVSSPDEYLDASGQPYCTVQLNYDMQRGRIQVLTVVEGSIIVDFMIMASVITDQPSASALFDAIKVLLDNRNSPLCKDPLFGRFTVGAMVDEVNMTQAELDELASSNEFEALRSGYNIYTACNLQNDFRDGAIKCPVGAAASRFTALPWIVAIAALSSGLAPWRRQ